MARPPRLHFSGACYHVVLRGNHQEPLFGTAADRRVLNDIVAEALALFDCRIHAFCWMTNHLHALIQVADRPLGRIVQSIAVRYSRYRHKLLDTSGHLFERRHKARLVDVDTYFLTLLRYIHLNPVKAKVINDPADYQWSSHRAYLGAECIPWLTTEFGLSLFSRNLMQARAAYATFIHESRDGDDEDLENDSHPDDCRILGTDEFIARLQVIPYTPRSPMTLDELAESVCTQNKIECGILRSPVRARRLTSIRVDFSMQAIQLRIATLSEIARFLNRDPSSIAKLMARHKAKGKYE